MLDADEELSGELKQSLLEWKAGKLEVPVYEMARLTWYLGAWIHHSRWYPDWQRRIYQRQRAAFTGTVHEALRFEGQAGRLRGDLLHYTMSSFAEHEEKLERYSSALAQEMFSQGRRRLRGAMWVAAPWSWVRHFLFGAGFLDGYRGALIAQMAARGVWLKFKKLGELIAAEKCAKSQGAP